MRYANYHHSGRVVNTAGDNIQTLAMDYIYTQMGVNHQDIVYIDTYDLHSYDGEYVVLPVYLPMFNYVEKGIAGMFSPKITPVFIAITWPLDTLSDDEVDYLKKYEPIGCRDERTLMTMRKYGVQSYLNGCITVVFPLSTLDRTKCEKIYIVDVPDKLFDYIPDQILKNAIMISHNLPGNLKDAKKEANDIYQMYLKDAKMVISSLLHCVIPCMAAGIPTIFAKMDFPYRAAWVEKLIHLYTENEFSSINWNPDSVIYEDHKNNVIQLVKKRISSTYNKYSDIYSISFFYEQRNRKEYTTEYTDKLRKFIIQKWKKHEYFTYSIWGLTHFAKYVYEYISSNYPNASLTNVYDRYRNINFNGHDTLSPENIVHDIDEFIFVTSAGASVEATELFKQVTKAEDSYFLLTYGDKKHINSN